MNEHKSAKQARNTSPEMLDVTTEHCTGVAVLCSECGHALDIDTADSMMDALPQNRGNIIVEATPCPHCISDEVPVDWTALKLL